MISVHSMMHMEQAAPMWERDSGGVMEILVGQKDPSALVDSHSLLAEVLSTPLLTNIS